MTTYMDISIIFIEKLQICREGWFANGWKFDLQQGEHDLPKGLQNLQNLKSKMCNVIP